MTSKSNERIKIEWYVAQDGTPLLAIVRHPSRWEICIGDTEAEIASGIVDALEAHGISQAQVPSRTTTLRTVCKGIATATEEATFAIVDAFAKTYASAFEEARS